MLGCEPSSVRAAPHGFDTVAVAEQCTSLIGTEKRRKFANRRRVPLICRNAATQDKPQWFARRTVRRMRRRSATARAAMVRVDAVHSPGGCGHP